MSLPRRLNSPENRERFNKGLRENLQHEFVGLCCAYMRSRPELKVAQQWVCMDCQLFGLVFAPLSLARSFLKTHTQFKKTVQTKIRILSLFTNLFTFLYAFIMK